MPMSFYTKVDKLDIQCYKLVTVVRRTKLTMSLSDDVKYTLSQKAKELSFDHNFRRPKYETF